MMTTTNFRKGDHIRLTEQAYKDMPAHSALRASAAAQQDDGDTLGLIIDDVIGDENRGKLYNIRIVREGKDDSILFRIHHSYLVPQERAKPPKSARKLKVLRSLRRIY